MHLRETKSKCIDGFTYEVTQLGAIQASKTFVRLLKTLGPILMLLKKGKDGDLDLSEAFDCLHEDDVQYFCDVFGPLTNVPGVGELRNATLDQHFTGRLMSLFNWLAFCIEVNFAEFLSGKLEGLLAKAQAAVPGASASTSPKAATGPAGAS